MLVCRMKRIFLRFNGISALRIFNGSEMRMENRHEGNCSASRGLPRGRAVIPSDGIFNSHRPTIIDDTDSFAYSPFDDCI